MLSLDAELMRKSGQNAFTRSVEMTIRAILLNPHGVSSGLIETRSLDTESPFCRSGPSLPPNVGDELQGKVARPLPLQRA
jgi:hypothetical protein